MKPVKSIVLADVDPLSRYGLKVELSAAGWQVIESLARGQALLDLVNQFHAQVVIGSPRSVDGLRSRFPSDLLVICLSSICQDVQLYHGRTSRAVQNPTVEDVRAMINQWAEHSG